MPHLVAPGGEGPSRTITRAELLAAIWAAMRMGATTIMSDSAAALWLVRRAVMEPMTLKRHLHRPLLEAIVDLVRSAESPVAFLKCKAHSGLYGNEVADRAAKLAAQGRCDVTCDAEAHPFEPLYWPIRRDDEGQVHYLSDLSKGLRAAAKATCSLGAAPTDGVYVTAWRDTAPHTHRELSNGFSHSAAVGMPTKRMVWKARCGLIYDKKLERRYKKQGDGLCPLCGQPDGTGHIISGCPALSSMYTERHNAVGRIILNFISKGRYGAQVVQHDVGCTAKLRGDGICGTGGRMVPECTLPDEALAGLKREQCSRPDITLDWRHAESRAACAWSQRYAPDRSFKLVEIKICSDTDPAAQLQKAGDQHNTLLTMLNAHWGRDKAVIVPLAFGASTGTIFDSAVPTLKSLGVPPDKVTPTLAKIHTTICQHLRSIVGTRRARERELSARGGAT